MKITLEGVEYEGTPEEIKDMMMLMGAEFPTKDTEEKAEAKPRTVKRQARVGERILITEAAIGEPYNTGNVFTVSEIDVIAAGDVRVKETSQWIDYREYEVIIEEESEPAPTFRIGDRVKTIVPGQFSDIGVGRIGKVEDVDAGDGEDDPYTISVESGEFDSDYFRPQDLELVEDEPYKPAEGDIVVITANTNGSRNAVGDIGKVGKVDTDGIATVDVPDKPHGRSVSGNWTELSEMRPATDEEKAEYERVVANAEFKVGDYAKVIEESHNGDIPKGSVVKIKDVDDGHIPYLAELIDGSDWDWFRGGRLTRISETEAKLAVLGRKPGEFKKGDIVRVSWTYDKGDVDELTEIHSGPEGCGAGGNYYICGGKDITLGEELELIAPVESRVDLDE